MKKAKTFSEAFLIQENFEGKPHCFIQWRGTDVCMDVRCKCGANGHVDNSFTYQLKCTHCGTIYSVGCFVELIELEESDPSAVDPIPFKDDTLIEGKNDSN